ncbi:hypothetical protein [Photobacterium atrarenae]|uniref:Cation transporter n=1 Tax=Photobacterium atrarenae TaxID=865757 RepID=A0ABY5GHT1_9GAMM|nr:hypothetical protein [Photobacterium atrarenae]UTV28837.1 hypothetical protein NNL38_06265 [Photobacterium atrarenae]
MFAKHRSYTLAGKVHNHAHLAIKPTGELSVEILEEHKQLEGDFEDLSFSTHGKITGVDCVEHDHPSHKLWHIDLSRQDARELNRLIDDAKEEYEIMMRDLC